VTGRPVLVVDAGALYEVVAATSAASEIRQRLATAPDHLAPHLVDVEVLRVIRRHHHVGLLDPTAARQAVDDLHAWPGERVSHRPLLDRAWQLRDTVRIADALYVALAEAMRATLLTTDARLGRASGPRCDIEVVSPG
jgi:predicted nucleic acid-binding protein